MKMRGKVKSVKQLKKEISILKRKKRMEEEKKKIDSERAKLQRELNSLKIKRTKIGRALTSPKFRSALKRLKHNIDRAASDY